MAGVKYIGPVFDGCYDDKTEVLTSEGWLFFKDLSYGHSLATLTPEGILEYHKPDQLIMKDWEGPMCYFHNSRNGIDLLVTPDHNMYVAPEIYRRNSRKSKGFRFEKAAESINKHRLFKKNCRHICEGMSHVQVCNRFIRTEDWLEFLGYYLSEGSSTLTRDKHYIVQLRQTKSGLERMANSLQKVSTGKVNIRPDGRAIVNDKELATYLKKTFGDCYTKFIPRDILDGCSSDQLRVLLEALLVGNGHVPEGGGSSYYTASKRLCDDFMELLLKTGLSGSFYKNKIKGEQVSIKGKSYNCREDNWTITVRWKQHVVSVDGRTSPCGITHYSGKVYCASVTNHVLFVRRGGKSVWCGNSGYAEAARNYVLSIHRKGYPITLAPITFEKTRPELGKEGEILRSLINNNVDYDKIITHSTPDLWGHYTKFERNKYLIGYTVWETSNIHPTWTMSCNRANEVWVPCDWNMQVFRDSGVKVPLHKIPHAIDVPDLNTVPEFNLEGISEDDFVFYSIFQWQERKNPYGLLAAYTSAFTNVDDVVLVLKTYRHDHAGDKDSIKQLVMEYKKYMTLDHFPKMYLIVENMSSENILALHRRGDCFTLLQRSEGWGLPHFEAASMGNPVITPAYGGQTDFLKEDNSYLIDYQLTPVTGMPWSPYYRGDQWWCEPDIKQAVDTMRHVYQNRDEAKEKGLRARQYVQENFTWDRIGDMIVERLTQIDQEGIVNG